MKNINFIYGLGDRASRYKALSRYLNVVEVDWNNPEKVKIPKSDILVGFSMGCFLALDYAEKHEVELLILCSLPASEKIGKTKAKKVIFMAGDKEKFIINNLKKQKGFKILVKGGHAIEGAYKKKLLEIIKLGLV